MLASKSKHRALFLLFFSLALKPCFGEVWLQPLYYSDQEQLVGDLQAYSSNSGAILFGGDKLINSKTLLGIGASYFNVVQSYCNYPNLHIDVQNYQGFLYGAFYFARNMELDWLLSAGVNNYKQHYVLNNTANSTASYDGQQFVARVVGLKTYQKNSIKFIPQLSASILQLHTNPYYETGVLPQVNANSLGVFMLGAGFTASADYSRGRIKAKPEIRCLVFYDVMASDVNGLTAILIGGPALQTSAQPDRPSGQFGASITFMIYPDLNCSFNYDLLVKNVYFNNVLSLKFNYLM